MKLEKFSNKKICVALSGGADSVALLHYLRAQKENYGYTLSAVHCEHGIRGQESLLDKAFVEALCRKWDIPLTVFCEDCIKRSKEEKESLETSARNFRRESFFKLVKEHKADYIATAHHRGDEAETVLLHLARGASLSGVKGIAEEDGAFIRPILSWSKKEILEYVEKNDLSYCVDETNFQTDATRNKIRLNVLPNLCEAVPSAEENIVRFAKYAREDDEYLYTLSNALITREQERITVAFCDVKPLFFRACITALKELGITKDYTSKHLESVYLLQQSERGATAHLHQGVRAEKTLPGICFYFYKREEILLNKEQPFDETGYDGGRYVVNITTQPPTETNDTWKTLRFDKEKVPADAVFRFRREGDTIEKFGGETKTLKKLFNEKKIPPKERGAIPLIADSKTDKVYCVCGVEIADFLKGTESTKEILYVVLTKK